MLLSKKNVSLFDAFYLSRTGFSNRMLNEYFGIVFYFVRFGANEKWVKG